MKTPSFILLSWVLGAGSYAVFGQTPYLEPRLNPGPYRAGFTVFQTFDNSRTLQQDVYPYTQVPVTQWARPIQISVWYPAVPENPDQPMSCSRYVGLMATEMDFSYTGPVLEHPFVKARLIDNASIQRAQLDLLMAAPSGAYENAPAAEGKFPVIVYAPGGFGSNFENAVMFEYLASHGYIVASYPSLEIDHSPAGHKGEMGPWIFEPHARDLEFVISFMQQYPHTNMHKLGVMGFSLGGASVVTVLCRNRQVQAAVSLDGWHESNNFTWMPFVDLQKIRVPFLQLTRGYNKPNPNRIVYDSLRMHDGYYVSFNKLGHVFFGSSWILLTDHASNDWSAVRGTQEEINLGYSLLSEYVHQFFEAYLNRDAAALKRLKQLHLSGKIPEGFLSTSFKLHD